MQKVYYKLTVAGWQDGQKKEEQKCKHKNTLAWNQNLTVSQGNLSFCQTSLTVPAEPTTVHKKLQPPKP